MIFFHRQNYNKSVDAFLCERAYREIRALSLLPGKKKPAGLLLGHLRGPRIFIERIWPTEEGFRRAAEYLWELEKALGCPIVGFFAYLPSRRYLQAILKPFACGKILVEIRPEKRNSFSLKCSLIDFSHAFKLFPCPLQIESRGKK